MSDLRNYITLKPVQIGSVRLKSQSAFHARNTDYMCALLDNNLIQLMEFCSENVFIPVERDGFTPQSVTGLAAADCESREDPADGK